MKFEKYKLFCDDIINLRDSTYDHVDNQGIALKKLKYIYKEAETLSYLFSYPPNPAM